MIFIFFFYSKGSSKYENVLEIGKILVSNRTFIGRVEAASYCSTLGARLAVPGELAYLQEHLDGAAVGEGNCS